MRKNEYIEYFKELFRAKLTNGDVQSIINRWRRSEEDAKKDMLKLNILNETLNLLIKKSAETTYDNANNKY